MHNGRPVVIGILQGENSERRPCSSLAHLAAWCRMGRAPGACSRAPQGTARGWAGRWGRTRRRRCGRTRPPSCPSSWPWATSRTPCRTSLGSSPAPPCRSPPCLHPAPRTDDRQRTPDMGCGQEHEHRRSTKHGEDRDTEKEAVHIEDYVRDGGLRLRRRAVIGASGCHCAGWASASASASERDLGWATVGRESLVDADWRALLPFGWEGKKSTPPPQLWGGLIYPSTMKRSDLSPELFKTVYFTPWAGFQRRFCYSNRGSLQ